MSESEKKEQRERPVTVSGGERPSPEKASSAEGCPIKMLGDQVCGRPSLGPLIDGVAYCLMHIPTGKNVIAFQREFDTILQAAGDGVADFTEVVFPSANYEKREFTAACVFSRATFMQEVSFSRATFTRGANFNRATFAKGADFTKTKFLLDVDFSRARFMLDAVFSSTVFTRDAYFDGAAFMQSALFDLTTFTQTAGFSGSTFGQLANFDSAMFTQGAYFERVRFTQEAFFSAGFMQGAYFSQATFMRNAVFVTAMFARNAHFHGVEFAEDADFTGATFAEDAAFVEATFTGDANFHRTTCPQKISFEKARFLGRAEFRETAMRRDAKPLPGPVFSSAEFSQPEKVIFYKTYLGQALFHNCDVSRVTFSSVVWRERKGSGMNMMFEEEVDLELAHDLKPPEGSPDVRNYGLIAELYQQMKKNYDERKDYWTAGDFHYGELEMKRLSTSGRILGERHMGSVRGWCHRWFSLVAWYKYASLYGESYARPLLCLALVLLLFTFLFPIVGLDCNDAKSSPGRTSATQQTSSQTVATDLSYDHFSDFVKVYKGRKWLARPAFFGNSLMTALSVAGFQKELKYEPSYPWGRALSLLELLLTSTLAALFLLAVRRQFRR